MEHLIGKKIKWSYDGECIEAVVGIIDENIGLTIVKAEDTEHNLTCIHLAQTVDENWRKRFEEDPRELLASKAAFDKAVEMIEDGHYIGEKVDEAFNEVMGIEVAACSYGALECAFV